MLKKQDRIARRVWMSVAGVFVCGISVGLLKYAAFGVDPFQSFMAGLAQVIPISFGLLYMLASIVLLSFAFCFDKSKIGLGTIINLTLQGYAADYTHRLLLYVHPQPGFGLRLCFLAVGLVVLSASVSFYFTANLGVSAYDAVALVLAQRNPRLPFRLWRICTDIVCVSIGVFLFFAGGNPASRLGLVAGVGTILSALCMGPLIEYFNRHLSQPVLNHK